MNTGKNIVNLSRVSMNCPDCRLKDLCVTRGLPAHEVEELYALVHHGRPLPRGQYLFRQGDRLNSVYLVKTGSVKSYLTAADGTEQVVGFYLAGDLLGLDAVEQTMHGCSAVTLEHTSLCELPFPRMEQLCSRYPQLLHEVLSKLGAELMRDHHLRLLVSQRGAEERLAIFLVDLGARLGARGFSSSDLHLSMSRYDIANYLGVAAETVSRTFTRFEQKALLSVERRHVRIRDAARLQALAEHGPARADAGKPRSG